MCGDTIRCPRRNRPIGRDCMEHGEHGSRHQSTPGPIVVVSLTSASSTLKIFFADELYFAGIQVDILAGHGVFECQRPSHARSRGSISLSVVRFSCGWISNSRVLGTSCQGKHRGECNKLQCVSLLHVVLLTTQVPHYTARRCPPSPAPSPPAWRPRGTRPRARA